MLLWNRASTLRGSLGVAATVGLAIMLVTGAALGVGSDDQTSGRTPPLIIPDQSGGAAPSASRSSLAKTFGVLAQPLEAADALGPALPGPRGADRLTEHGVDPADARLTRSLSGWGVWLVPGQDVVCLYASRLTRPEGGSACPYHSQGSDGFLLSVGAGADVPAGHLLVAGVVPDGVDQVRVHSAGGGTQTLDVVQNAYVAVLPEDAMSISYTDSNGPQSRLVPSCGRC